MNLKQLKQAGAFVSAEPVAKEVVWSHKNDAGEVVEDRFTVYIKRQSFGTIEQLWSGDSDRSRSATFISASVLLGEERESMSYEDAYQLDPSLAHALVKAINEVNKTGQEPPKN